MRKHGSWGDLSRVAFALAIAYFVFISRRYAGKVSLRRDNQGFYQKEKIDEK